MWKSENFLLIPLDQFPVHIFSIDSEILQGTQSGRPTGNVILLFLYNSLCMDTWSILFLYIIDVWTPDPSSFYWCMDTRSIIFSLMYGHLIHHLFIDVWTPDPSSFELHTVTIVCLYTVLSLRVRGARLYVWYSLVLMDPLNTMVSVCSPFNSSYTGVSFLYGKNL